MHKHTEIFEKLFAKRITYAEIAKYFNLSVVATHRWNNSYKRNGKIMNAPGIPAKHHKKMVEFANSRGVDITMNDFYQAERKELDSRYEE